MRFKISFALLVILIASIGVEILFNALIGFIPAWVFPAKILLLLLAYALTRFIEQLRSLSAYALILAGILTTQIGTSSLAATPFWSSAFDFRSFAGVIGSSILLKAVSIVPLLGLLGLLLPSKNEFYFCKGDLSITSSRISWLGIEGGRIGWGKLSLISGVLIASGTILLTMITVTGFSFGNGIGRLFQCLPVILLFAMVNSFCEGIVFRNAVLGTLRNALPKHFVVLLAAVLFGIAHYYGAPGGPLGMVMAGALGWYMCRSMYETGGLVSSWIIHFMQDVVIFSTMCVAG